MLYWMGMGQACVRAQTGAGWGMRCLGLFVTTLGLCFVLIAVLQYVIAFMGPAGLWFWLLVGVGLLLMAVGSGLALIDRA